MEKSDAFKLGKIVKSQGKNGELVFLFDTDKPEQFRDLRFIFIEIDERLIPFQIDSLDLKGNYAKVNLEDIDSPESGQVLVGNALYLPAKDLPELPAEQYYFQEIIGYTIIDQQKGELGIVKDILKMPEQSLIQVFHKNKEILIPLADELIQSIDKKTRQITILAPEGLIDLYLDF